MMDRHQKRWLLVGSLPVLLALLVVNWRGVTPPGAETVAERAALPPSVAVTTMALGPLRGLVSNVLWWRSVRLQDEGNYFEAIQLADWITTLQPRLSGVWRYQAWNMVFNLSVGTPERDERWQWILAGIDLLRFKGLRWNPDDPELRRELSNIFYTKLAKNVDPMSRYYKHQWALRMGRYLDRGDGAELAAIAAAPRTAAGLSPAARDLLAKAVEIDLLDRAALADLGAAPDIVEEVRRFAVRQALWEKERFDIDRMVAVEQAYGPLDWRLGQAYAIYYGVHAGTLFQPDGTRADHATVRAALLNSFEQGRVVYLDPENLILANNLEVGGRIHDYLEGLLDTQPSRPIASSFVTFHEFGAVILYNYGYVAEARNYFQQWLDFQGDRLAKPPTFEQFIAERAPMVLNVGGSVEDAESLVFSSLFQGYYVLALGEDYRAAGFQRLARLLWDRHQARFKDQPDRQLPPFDQLRRAALERAIERAPAAVRMRLERLRNDGEAPAPAAAPKSPPPDIFVGKGHEDNPAESQREIDLIRNIGFGDGDAEKEEP